jgi:phenylalanyl-tRNA synthetase alpha chain
MLLRTHTSCVQVKEARKSNPPFGIICPGIVYRNEATDASHDFMFAQIEGLFVSENANLSNLLYVLKKSMRNFFGNDLLTIRARPGTFPFVEPGLEIDCECPFCENGCSVCKKTKWIEVGGAGIVHPFVMSQMGIEDKNILGWAFGMGITRLAMLKYKINDIRKLHNSYKAC